MPRRYATGQYALGECARSGRVMPYRDMVYDGLYPHLKVDPAWYEPPYPLQSPDAIDTSDPVALKDPAPRRDPD